MEHLPSGGVRNADCFLTSTHARTVVSRGLRFKEVYLLARVIITLRVMPEDVDVDLDELFEKIKRAMPEGTDVRANEIVPIAFGLKAIRMNVARNESLGGPDDIEAAIMAIDGVAQVEVEMLSRM